VLLLVRCVHGTEWVAAAELADVLGVAGRLARREVVTALPGPDPRLLGLACADDVFAVVGEVPATDPTRAGLAPLAAAVAALDWPGALADVLALRDAPPVAFDCVASLEGRRSHDRVAAEDAVGAALAPVLGLPFASRSGGAAPDADLTVRVFLRPGTAVVALRVGRRPLHRRDWKRDTGPGTPQRAVRWTGGAAYALPTLGGGTSAAVDVNDRGDVSGFSVTPAGEAHAVAWRRGVLVDLGPAGADSGAGAINQAGQLIGSAATPDERVRGLRWTLAG